MTDLPDMSTPRKPQLRLFDVAVYGGGRRATSQLELEHLLEHGEIGSLHPIEPRPYDWKDAARELGTIRHARELIERYGFDEGIQFAAFGLKYAIFFDSLCPEPKQAEVERWLRLRFQGSPQGSTRA